MKKPNLAALLRLQAEIARENAAALDDMADVLEAHATADVLEARAQEQEPENETRPH